jgi:hypothetical protein
VGAWTIIKFKYSPINVLIEGELLVCFDKHKCNGLMGSQISAASEPGARAREIYMFILKYQWLDSHSGNCGAEYSMKKIP